jgi:di/tricarboxylate transporter
MEGPLLAGTIGLSIVLGQKLLPERSGPSIPVDFSRLARTLVEQYGLSDGFFRMRVRAASPYAGSGPETVDLAEYPELELIAIQDGATGGRLQRPLVQENDRIILRGNAESAATLAAEMHLAFRQEDAAADVEETLFNRQSGLAEVMIPPRSRMIGEMAFPGMTTPSGDLIVIAVQRQGIDAGPKGTVLEVGDTILLQGTWKALDMHLADPDVLVVNSPDVVRSQAVPLGLGARQTIIVLVVMVLLLATGIVPPAIAGLLAAGALVLTKVITIEQSYRAIDWTTVILVGAMMPLSTAMEETGAAKMLAELLVQVVGDAGPYALLAGLFVLTAVLGQLISNTATALIVIPISLAAALSIGVSPRPVLISVAVAASASFLTPIATPTNLMVMSPGGYAFGDYWKFGLPMMIWFAIIAIFYVPLIWRF